MNDPRMITALGVLLGIDMQAFSRPEGSDEQAETSQRQNPSQPKPTAPSKQQPQEEATAELLNETEEDKAKKAADHEKRLGSEAYRQRNFSEAERAFSKAWQLYPKDITYLTNLSGDCVCLCCKGMR